MSVVLTVACRAAFSSSVNKGRHTAIYSVLTFYPRDVYVSAVLASYGNVAGCLSVTRQYSIKTAKPIVKLFQPPGSTISLVSSDPCADTQFQRKPLQRGYKYTGCGKIWRFSTEIAVYLGNGARQADGYYGTLIGSHGCRIGWDNFR